MQDQSTRTVNSNGISLHTVAQGQGPLVVLCHGWPGLAYSWRLQLPALAKAGYQAVALDTRGYGRSDRPSDFSQYSYQQQCADILAVIEAYGAEKAILVGHDFGANLTWYMALHCPEKLHAMVSVSVPYQMPLACGTSTQKPSELFAAIASQHFFHMHYFQTPKVAEKEFNGRETLLLKKLFWALSAQGNLLNWENYPAEGTGYLDVLESPASELPWSWMTAEALEHYVKEYLHAGAEKAFIGGLSAYRVLDINYEINKAYLGATVEIPALFIAGSEDPVINLTPPECWQTMQDKVVNLAGKEIIADAGHFVQQEQPEATNQALIAFFDGLNLSA